MKDLIDKFTLAALKHHDDGATREFYRRLREDRKFQTTACKACQHTAYPPRPFCPACFSKDVEWVDVATDGTLYAFTTQARGLRFMAPDVVGVVEIEGIGRIVSKINAPLDKLAIGQKVRFEPFEVSEDLVVHSYSPVL